MQWILLTGSIVTTAFILISIIHLRLMVALKDNRDFIVYFAGAYNKTTNNSLENYTRTRLFMNCWIYAFLYGISWFCGVWAVLPLLLSILLFYRDLNILFNFWNVLFPAISRARYYPIQPPSFQ